MSKVSRKIHQKTLRTQSNIYDIRLGSKYASSFNLQVAYFINWTFRKSGPLEKENPGPIEKANIHCIAQKHPYDKLEVADFKYDNNSLNLKPKII